MSPKVRQTIYYAGTLISTVIGVALLWGGLSADTASSILNMVGGIVTLLGGAAPAIAAKKVGEQMNNGAFDQSSPADQVVNGINAVLAQAQSAQADVERVKEAVTAAVRDVPVLGPLAQQAIDSLKLP